MKHLLCVPLAVLLLCVPAYAMTAEEGVDIILDYHGIETDTPVAGYLTLDAEVMTREAAVTAVVRSFGVYPADEPDYIWADEEEQGEQYRPYIDYARRMGITDGVGGDRFAPGSPVTEWALRAMLERADGIEPAYPLAYDAPLHKLLSADVQRGLSLVPAFLVDRFYREDRAIYTAENPIVFPNGSNLSDKYVGYIEYEGDMWLSVECDNTPYWRQDRTVIHEIGHYLGHRTALLDRNTVPEELDWLMHRYRKYCNESNHEFFADSFVAYILWPEEMAENAPVTYQHIEMCLREIADRLAHGTCAPEQ